MPAEMRKLSKRRMNGRQIKNTIKVAAALADHKDAALTFDHVMRIVTVTEGSTAEAWFCHAKGLLGCIEL
jgi:hypothetical protein